VFEIGALSCVVFENNRACSIDGFCYKRSLYDFWIRSVIILSPTSGKHIYDGTLFSRKSHIMTIELCCLYWYFISQRNSRFCHFDENTCSTCNYEEKYPPLKLAQYIKDSSTTSPIPERRPRSKFSRRTILNSIVLVGNVTINKTICKVLTEEGSVNGISAKSNYKQDNIQNYHERRDRTQWY
jgi:hypothetical protein